MKIKNVNKIMNFINVLSDKTGVDIRYLLLIPIVCIGFNDFPYMILLTRLNIHYAKYATYIFTVLYLGYLLFSDKKTGNFIFASALYIIVNSINLALQRYYDLSLNTFVLGFTLLVKYLYEFYLSKNQYNTDHEKITLKNIQNEFILMGIVLVFTKLSLLFSKYFLDIFLRNYYLSLKHTNDYRAIFLFIFIEYKYYVSILIFLIFLAFILQQEIRKDK